ncbi:RHS repeat domain-containing protein [Zhouia amylolytica]|uniref:Rhs family protein n=1 Tax=Zhouia amylolytica AD3 TaxID=1286632 RepID=W2ULN8_9FLAO|nr:RHS repeat protein [Zhouia amylolytica]ETN94341.1 hypothetical protein P278_22830 [Zhouia amylolytica AD3]
MNIFQKTQEEKDFKRLFVYDLKGREIYTNTNGIEQWFVYDNDLLYKHVRSDGFTRFFKYNQNGGLLSTKDTSGFEEWCEYDENGHKRRYKNSKGKEEYFEYTAEGRLLLFIPSNDVNKATIYRYDGQGNQIYLRDKLINMEEWWDYNNKGEIINHRDNKGLEEWFEYDEKGRLIKSKTNEGLVETRCYDNENRLCQIKNNAGYEQIYKYDTLGNQTYYKSHVIPKKKESWEEKLIPAGDAFEEWKVYNDQGLLIHYKNSAGNEKWIDYDDYGNETNYKNIDGVEVKKEYLFYEELQDDTQWLFSFEQL